MGEDFKVGFILTMWYVNEKIDDLLGADYLCFILTMWYVNLNIPVLQ